MRNESKIVIREARRVIGWVVGGLMMATAASAQSPQDEPGRWRIGASTGAYVPFSSLIRTADLNDTRLAAGPAFSLEPQFQASPEVSVYLNALLAFASVQPGSSLRPEVIGSSEQVILGSATAGAFFTPDWLSGNVQPTLRVGGGLKMYAFDLAGAENQVRPTADIGVGLRGIGLGAIDVSAEVRYLPSSFDQSKLPIRGIAPQNQRQSDLLFSIGIGVR